MKILIGKEIFIFISLRLRDLFSEFPFISWISYMFAFLQTFKKFGSDLTGIYILYKAILDMYHSHYMGKCLHTLVCCIYIESVHVCAVACVFCGGIFASISSFLCIKSTQLSYTGIMRFVSRLTFVSVHSLQWIKKPLCYWNSPHSPFFSYIYIYIKHSLVSAIYTHTHTHIRI